MQICRVTVAFSISNHCGEIMAGKKGKNPRIMQDFRQNGIQIMSNPKIYSCNKKKIPPCGGKTYNDLFGEGLLLVGISQDSSHSPNTAISLILSSCPVTMTHSHAPHTGHFLLFGIRRPCRTFCSALSRSGVPRPAHVFHLGAVGWRASTPSDNAGRWWKRQRPPHTTCAISLSEAVFARNGGDPLLNFKYNPKLVHALFHHAERACNLLDRDFAFALRICLMTTGFISVNSTPAPS